MPQLTTAWLVFCATAVAAFWVLPDRLRPHWLTACSVGLLLWLDPVSALLAGACIALLEWPVAAGFVGLFCAIRIGELVPGLGIAAPIGFAFYVLRLVHLRVDRELFRATSYEQRLRYLIFFPTLLIGPIHRFEDFQRDEARRRWDDARFAAGLERVLYGYVKVVVLANWLVFHQGFFVPPDRLVPGALVVFECVQYGSYLYLVFAGYSDVAIGVGKLLGYELPDNFDRPYLASDLSDFWRRWHITLSDWCRRYVFLPVFARTKLVGISLVASMIVLGLWHEFSLRYLVWGLWHGVGLAVFRVYEAKLWPRLPAVPAPVARGLGIGLTLAWVVVGFVFTKNGSPDALFADFGHLLDWRVRG